MPGNAPHMKLRIGYVFANIWKNEGSNGDWYNVTIERSYRDDDGNIKSTDSLGPGDLLNAVKLLQRAEELIFGL